MVGLEYSPLLLSKKPTMAHLLLRTLFHLVAFALVRGLSTSLHSRREALNFIPSVALATATTFVPESASAAAGETKFQRYPSIRFIAALGDPKASSGTGAESWGLWKDDPGPRGVYLRDYDRRLVSTGGKAPAGWILEPDSIWIEEHGLIMPSPGDLVRRSYKKSTKETLPYKRYVVTGDREVTTALTVHDDGRWELAKGTLYDVTHLPCRTGRYTPSGQAGSCVPTADDQKRFPVKPGAAMPDLSGQCNTKDYAVLFVLGEEVFS